MIAEIENAILARLRGAADADVLGYKWATLETYPANWDDYLKEKVIRAPAAWAVFAGFSKGVPVGFGGVRFEASFGVVVMAENMRNETAQRHGDAAGGVGSYQLAQDAIALLQGESLGLDIDAIEVRGCHIVRTQAITKERKISMLALELATEVSLQGATSTGFGTGSDIGDFRTFHADWDLPPFGGIDADPTTPGEQLPDDAHADAVDDATLETSL